MTGARTAAAALLDQQRAAGEAEAARLRHRADREAREEARRLVLEAQHRVHTEARRAVREAALQLRGEPGYAALLDGLRRMAAERLGGGADLQLDPPASGGVIGRSGTRVVDLTLPAVADRCAEAEAARFAALWR